MSDFLAAYSKAALTTLSFFWMALWAFILGYVISAMIQVFVTRDRMQGAMGGNSAKATSIAAFLGFINSSCSFAALATTRSLFKKGAGFIPSIAFLLASTNLVIELGIVISIFLGWQFVVGEYLGAVLLILFSALLIRLTRPWKLVKQVREKMGEDKDSNKEKSDWKKMIRSKEGWTKVSKQYFMEWKMVWKDVTVGFTLAGIIAVFVPSSFFNTLFIGSGAGTTDFSLVQLLEHVLVAPIAAFCTFIGSMGNIPLAVLLFKNGVSFAGVMAFIFSDLVVFPVLRINAKYYGWKMSMYIAFLLLASLVVASLVLHFGFSATGLIPNPDSADLAKEGPQFSFNYTFYLNIAFLAVTGIFFWMKNRKAGMGSASHNKSEDSNSQSTAAHHHTMGDQQKHDYKKIEKGKMDHAHMHHEMSDKGVFDKVLKVLAFICYLWLAGGLIVALLS